MLQKNIPLADLISEAKEMVHARFKIKASVVAAAPGRVNLIGEHIDYCDGFVLPFAIERYIVVAAAPNDTKTARIYSPKLGEISIPLDQKQVRDGTCWGNYIRGIIHGFQERGHHLGGFDACVVSSVPNGAGLSSSAALECAFATLFEGLLDTVLDTKEKALLAQKAEHDFAGMPCGIMDQFASAFGRKDHLILIDCHSEEPESVPFLNPDLSILIANTCVSHSLIDGAYASRRQDTVDALESLQKRSWRDVSMNELSLVEDDMDERIFRRSRHVITEIKRTTDAALAFKNNDFSNIGILMAASHHSLRDDFEVSCHELDLLVEYAQDIGFEGGVLGSRMTGGGFGGSTVTLCRTNDLEAIANKLHQRYLQETGITPQIFASRPAEGAHLCH